jgi:hypothetical protein
MRRRRSGGRTPEIMLGRVVTHSSPAELSDQLAPHPDWAQQIILQQMNPKREHPKPGAMTSPPTKPTQTFDPGGQTQTPAYKQYRAGERAAAAPVEPLRDPYAYGLYSI